MSKWIQSAASNHKLHYSLKESIQSVWCARLCFCLQRPPISLPAALCACFLKYVRVYIFVLDLKLSRLRMCVYTVSVYLMCVCTAEGSREISLWGSARNKCWVRNLSHHAKSELTLIKIHSGLSDTAWVSLTLSDTSCAEVWWRTVPATHIRDLCCHVVNTVMWLQIG